MEIKTEQIITLSSVQMAMLLPALLSRGTDLNQWPAADAFVTSRLTDSYSLLSAID